MQTEGMQNNSERQPLSGENNNSQPQMVAFSELLRYATSGDKILMYIGAFVAFINGSAFPLFNVIFGQMTDSFGANQTPDGVVETAKWNTMWFLIVGAATFICSFLMFATWMISGERQAIQYRKKYFRAIIHQEIGWFDTINPNELASKVANETFAIQGAIGEKVPTFIMTFSMTFFGFLIGFIWGWQLALVISCSLPAMSLATAVFTVVLQGEQTATQAAYSEAGGLAEEVEYFKIYFKALNAIKTVKMLDGEDYQCHRYGSLLQKTVQTTLKFSLYQGLAFGFVWGIMIWSYALGFWYGSKLIREQVFNHNRDQTYRAGDVLIIFFSILTGGFSLGQAGPCVQNFASGRMAAVNVFKVLDRQPKIQNPINPKKIQQFKGCVKFQAVEFTYPNRQDVQILKKMNLIIPPGKKVALVGESGCGKSTIMQLIERFYDSDQGSVTIDDVDVRDLILNDLRHSIGYVGQEPVLFATSIRENLLYGKSDATEEEMIQVLKEVNAWNFIDNLEKKLDTYVGIGGGQLSGGQKQRIAIARAILKKPKILLLDEATSALDKTNEVQIQKTLDQVSKGITTIVIAHRLSTIQNCDIIFVVDQGVIVEQGTHDELMNKRGKYEELARHQFGVKEEEEKDGLQEDNQVFESPEKKSINGNELGSPSPDAPHQKLIQSEVKIGIQDPLQQPNIAQQMIVEGEKMMELIPALQKHHSQNSKKEDAKLNHQIEIQIEKKRKESVEVETEEQKKIRLLKEKQREQEIMTKLYSYNKEERPQFILGILISMANGCVFPIFSLYLSDMINVMTQINPSFYPPELQEQKASEAQVQADRISLSFFIIGIFGFVLWTFQLYIFSYVGEKLTLKLRIDTFRKLLRMPISYFDIPKNNAGTLASRLSVDCKLINRLTSSIIGINIMNVSSLICGMIIAFVGSWQLTLITLALAPIIFISGLLQAQFLQGFSDQTDSAYKDSGNLIMEAVCNIRTVLSFANEEKILGLYEQKVQAPLEKAKKKGVYSGLALGFSQSTLFIIYAIVFLIGAILHRDKGLSVLDMFTSIFAIMFSTFGMGNNAQFAGNIGEAKNAAKNLFELLDSKDEYQIEIEKKTKRLIKNVQGNIELKNISFKYPSREKYLFDNLNLVIESGNKVSLVGPSGCGKSTVMQMLLRFYDPIGGVILLDGENLQDYDIRELRKQFAVVSQEPVLFNGTIKENIRYNENATDEQIKEAAEKANALNFILNNQFEEVNKGDELAAQKFGQGFDRQVGPKGSQISGGQKQRIAIARAVLKNSHILLLDEATSALDSVSEQLVQESLNRIMQNKTTIAIAHRISTIKDSNIIYVFEDGKIVEQGTYQQLVEKKDVFYRLEQGIGK